MCVYSLHRPASQGGGKDHNNDESLQSVFDVRCCCFNKFDAGLQRRRKDTENAPTKLESPNPRSDCFRHGLIEVSPVSRKRGWLQKASHSKQNSWQETPGCSGRTSIRALLKLWSQMLAKGLQPEKPKARTQTENGKVLPSCERCSESIQRMVLTTYDLSRMSP